METPQRILYPLEFLKSDVKILLLLLNQPPQPENVLDKLWKNAVLKVCCDGGANRLYDTKHGDRYVPDFLCGDFDSIRDEVKDFFVQKKSNVVVLEDQDYTDFTKAARFAVQHCKNNNIEYDVIVAFNAIGGRLDHTLSNINTLYSILSLQNKPCYLLSDLDSVCLLKPVTTKIICDASLEAGWCGLIPVGETATNVTTFGLKYNLDNQALQFGSLISTSNSLDKDVDRVTVTTSHHLLWSLGYDASKV
ncbi:thiamin pyrophosphokinase 1-like isoform X1 [Hydractinia symbiolongicarpus]|uniref:thiamin pyrophosphokinase 1-like isoform X1 n=1 Tax=Hydractinia symbiolongicarpus TaxID=13093 RepID=UPI002550285E|nr:thiamin pyrophosphokinase 1-like isoform X1 [Hydractinia symbiolongicarpus]XP_057292712.1 thiamin pyrophosphokinase 1-like isoform X1 [Hydractinia symbiolongicarpus]XP_057292713.1 thiamin pyrophosphokinase 1-like isoform X1 [Hydractinia symbiolongicarpus]